MVNIPGSRKANWYPLGNMKAETQLIQLDMVLTATPLARSEEGKISDGSAQGTGPLAYIAG